MCFPHTKHTHTPVFLAMFSSRSGYLVSLCISMGMMSFSCSLRHCGLLSASCNSNTHTQPPIWMPKNPKDKSCEGTLKHSLWEFFLFCFFTLCRNMRLCYLYEGVEAWLFLLPALDLLQGPWLVTAKPGGQFLEPLSLCTLKLEKGGKHTIEHHSVPYRLNYSRPIITIRIFFSTGSNLTAN